MKSIRPPDPRREDFSLAEVLYVMWSRRMLVAGVAIAMLAAAVLFSVSREPVYTAESVISVAPGGQEPDSVERQTFLEDVLAVVADDDLVAQSVEEVGWTAGVEDFRQRLEPETFVSQNGSSGVIVSFSGGTAESSADAANAYSRLFVERVENLSESRLAGGVLDARASVESEASPPDSRSSPQMILYAAISVVAGVMVGGTLALLAEGRANTWRDARDAEMTLKAPVIGVIPDYSTLEKDAREEEALEKERP